MRFSGRPGLASKRSIIVIQLTRASHSSYRPPTNRFVVRAFHQTPFLVRMHPHHNRVSQRQVRRQWMC
jgi:hypothetical protein